MTKKLVFFTRELYGYIHGVLLSFIHIRKVRMIVNSPTYYPEKRRKNVIKRYLDNFIWILKFAEIQYYYNSYGLDIVGSRMKDYLTVDKWIRERNKNNYQKYKPNQMQIQILHDKGYFASYMSMLCPDCIPETLMLIYDGVPVFGDKSLIDTVKNHSSVFIKSISGQCGDGVYKLEYAEGKYFCSGKEISESEIDVLFNSGRYIVQKSIVQHDRINAINSYSINTLRIVTVRNTKGDINVLASILRMGTKRDLVVDNCALGGTYAEVGLDGKMRKYSYYEPNKGFGTKTDRHPVSGIVYEGFEIPFYKEACDLVINLHSYFNNIQSIGWDVAITENGPIVIEGNENYEMTVMQEPCGGLKKKWRELTR